MLPLLLTEELMNYLRHVYKSTNDLVHLVDSLSLSYISKKTVKDHQENRQAAAG